MMTTGSLRPSAKIYQFPTGGRFGSAGRREETRPATDLRASMAYEDVAGGSWYHEAAIRDADLASKP